MEALTGSQQISPSKRQVLRDQSYADTELKTQQTQLMETALWIIQSSEDHAGNSNVR